MVQNHNQEDDKLDLIELIAGLWSHKILIVLFTGLSIFVFGNHILSSEKKFKAKHIQIAQMNSNSGFNFSNDLFTCGSSRPDGVAGSGSAALIERSMGREFIILLKENFPFIMTLFQ